MDHIVHVFGIDTAHSTGVFLWIAGFSVGVITLLWIVGVIQGNHSVMDAWYGFAFAVPTWLAFTIAHAHSQIAVLLMVLASFHGCRLGWYLAARWRRYVPVHGGDPRYLKEVQKHSPGYWWKSFFWVAEPQAVIIILIGSPAVVGILLNRHASGQIGVLGVLGLVVFAIGLYHETLADGQLQSFLALDPRPRYLNTGVWTFSRHPNYFGNVCVWWGIWLVAMAGNTHVWWTVIGPVVDTIMLTGVLGSAYQDKYMGVRPEYQELIARTRRFFPIPLSGAALAANQDKLRAARHATADKIPVAQ